MKVKMIAGDAETDLQSLCSVEEVWEVKVHDVVASDDVRIQFLDKLGPFSQELGLCLFPE